jgi:ribosomal protein S18 acetylase RimI-like enzyme
MGLIRKLSSSDFESIYRIINEASQIYKGVIPEDRWKEPYMQKKELHEEISLGVQFYGWIMDNTLTGVMGIQSHNEVTLIRHSYVHTRYQRMGIGTKLLHHLIGLTDTPTILVGTWKDATWAIRFYENNGFRRVSREESNTLLRTYWSIPERQVETSIVLKLEWAN